ncbi:dihydrodipicolinate synthase family protein [Alsobacter sp. R-9]
MKTLRGNWATLLLPIRPDGSIDFGALEEEIDILAAAKVDGVYSNGTAGELHNQTEEEWRRIQETLVRRCEAAGTRYVIGACSPDPAVTLARVREAAALSPHGIQVVLPDWWPVTDAEAADFLAMVEEVACGVPLVLYNPPHAKRVLAPAEIANATAAAPSVVAVKLADGDAGWYAEARAHLAHLSLFVPGHHLATGVAEGVAAGAFSNVACLSPRGAQRWTDGMASDLPGALAIETRLRAFMDEHIAPFRRDHGFGNPALDKLLAAIGGWGPVGTRLRRPYRWIPESEAVRLRPVARDMLPELFD